MASDEALLLIESPSLAVSLLRGLNRMRSCGFLCDITIQTGPDVFLAHHVVLAAASPYFKGLLTPGSDSCSDGHSVVNIDEATAKDIHAFLEFVYTGRTTVVLQQLPALKATANLLQCITLCEACCLAEGSGSSKPECSAGPMDSATHLAPVLQDVALLNTEVTQAPDKEMGQRQVRPPAEGAVVNIEIDTNAVLDNRHHDRRNVKMESLSGVDSGSESESSSNTDDDDDDDDDDEEHSDCEHRKQLSKPVQPGDLCTVLPIDVAVPIRRPLFICGQCNREFQYEKSYTKHMKQTHGVQPDITYCCEACGQHFTSRCNLRSHQRHVHSNDRPFGCDVCAKTFKRQKDLRRHHIQIHEGGHERHYCSSCSKGLSSRSALRLHERTHTGDRPYHCTYCPARFSQPSAIKVHTRTGAKGSKPGGNDSTVGVKGSTLRQRNRRSRLRNNPELFEEYKAKNREYEQKYRKAEKQKLKTDPVVLESKRAKDRERQRRSRARKALQVTPVGTLSHKACGSRQQLHRATNIVKGLLPKSPRKKVAVVKRQAKEFGIKMKWPEKKTCMTRLAEGTINRIQTFYCRDDISRMAPGKKDVVTVRTANYQRKTPEAATW